MSSDAYRPPFLFCVHPDQLPPREFQQQLQNLQTLYGAMVLRPLQRLLRLRPLQRLLRLRSKLPSPAAAPAAPALAAAPTAAPAPLAAPAALAQCPGPRSTHLCLYVSETNTAQPPGKVNLMLSQAPSAASPEIPGHLPCVPRSTCISDHHRDGWTMSRLGVVLPASQTGHRGPPIRNTGIGNSGNNKDIARIAGVTNRHYISVRIATASTAPSAWNMSSGTAPTVNGIGQILKQAVSNPPVLPMQWSNGPRHLLHLSTLSLKVGRFRAGAWGRCGSRVVCGGRLRFCLKTIRTHAYSAKKLKGPGHKAQNNHMYVYVRSRLGPGSQSAAHPPSPTPSLATFTTNQPPPNWEDYRDIKVWSGPDRKGTACGG